MDDLRQARLENDPLLHEAAEWFIELRSDGVSVDRIAEWQHWLASADAHREAFHRVESFWRLSDRVTARWPTDAEVQQDDYSGVESITAWRARSKAVARPACERGAPSRLFVRPFRLALAGASLIAMIVVMAVVYWPLIDVTLQGGWRTSIHTGVAETRTLMMPDGSIMSVGGGTSLTATLLPHSRTVVLLSGEAYFQVAREPERPFTVQAASTTVTDIGTAFDVKRLLGGVVVAVAEGAVRISTPQRQPAGRQGAGSAVSSNAEIIQLRAGQSLSLQPFDRAAVVAAVNTAWVAGWREGRLQYVDEPLVGVVADLSRNSTRRIAVVDPAVANLRVTGVAFLDNIDGWLASLQATFPVRVVTEDNGTVLIEQRTAP